MDTLKKSPALSITIQGKEITLEQSADVVDNLHRWADVIELTQGKPQPIGNMTQALEVTRGFHLLSRSLRDCSYIQRGSMTTNGMTVDYSDIVSDRHGNRAGEITVAVDGRKITLSGDGRRMHSTEERKSAHLDPGTMRVDDQEVRDPMETAAILQKLDAMALRLLMQKNASASERIHRFTATIRGLVFGQTSSQA